MTMYSVAERDRRWALACELMDAENLHALLAYGVPGAVAGPDDYLSGGPSGAIVLFPRHGRPLALTDRPTAWIQDSRPDRCAYALAAALKEHHLSRSAIGVLGLEPYPPAHDGHLLPYTLWAALLELMPQTAFVPVWPQFVQRAMPQSTEEIKALTEGAGISSAMAAALLAAAPAEAYAAAMHAAHLRGAIPEVQLTRRGSVLLAELTCWYGYRETCRTLTLPAPDPRRHPDLAREHYQSALRALRPGSRFGQAYDTAHAGLPGNAHARLRGLNPRSLHAEAGQTIGYDMLITPGMTFALDVTCDLPHGEAVTYGGTALVTAHETISLT
ncbi:M24 family metallopeptidase [Nonomuraea sp. NPDC005501]|uniref:M24 family metallopeptidase n=1 Tax=Nonomuraea sp. NPDC005501 TaxID=3156884 RepID=UPI0033AFCC3D